MINRGAEGEYALKPFETAEQIVSFGRWLKENGAGGRDEWFRPSVLRVPENAGWIDWVKSFKTSAVAYPSLVDIGPIFEPVVGWSPTTGFSDTKIVEVGKKAPAEIVSGWLKGLLTPSFESYSFDTPVLIHVHPQTSFTYDSMWLSPQDLFALVSAKDLQMIVCITGEYFTMAMKGPEIEKGINYNLQRQVNSRARTIKRTHRVLTDKQMSLLSLQIGNELFGSDTPYDLAFYLGKIFRDEVVFRRFTVERVERKHRTDRVYLGWLEVDGSDLKLQEGSFRNYSDIYFRNFVE